MIIEAREDTITLRGEIRSNIWPAIQAAAALLLENHPTGIIIDCSGLTTITPKGAETFAEAFRYINAHNARIVVAALAPDLLEIGKSVPGMRSMVAVASTVEEARSSLSLEEVTPQRGKARLAGVVPVLGRWDRAVYYGDKLAIGENCEIHLIDLIKVPRTMPIGTPLPEREASGQDRLASAVKLLRETGIKPYTHFERVRSKSQGLIEFVSQLGAQFAVVSIDPSDPDVPHMDESEALALADEASFEVTLLKGAPSDSNHTAMNVVIPAVGEWKRALEHVCKLTAGTGAAINVVYSIAVPRTEAIDAPKPDAEAAAEDCAKEALRIGKRYGAKVTPRTERVRDPILGFMKLFNRDGYDLAAVGVMSETASDYHIAKAIADALLQDLPCEVVYLKAAQEPAHA